MIAAYFMFLLFLVNAVVAILTMVIGHDYPSILTVLILFVTMLQTLGFMKEHKATVRGEY